MSTIDDIKTHTDAIVALLQQLRDDEGAYYTSASFTSDGAFHVGVQGYEGVMPTPEGEPSVPRTDSHAYSRWTADGISRTIDHGEK